MPVKVYNKRFSVIQPLERVDTWSKFLKVTNPSLLISHHPKCNFCQSVVSWFQKTYSNLDREEDRSNLELQAEDEEHDLFDETFHQDMVTLCHEDYPVAISLGLPDFSKLKTKEENGTLKNAISCALNKRFPKAKVIQESEKQKQFREFVQQNVDWKKKNNGGCLIALGKGEGKTLCSSNALEHHPPKVAWIVVYKSLIEQTILEFSKSCMHPSDVVTEFNILSYEEFCKNLLGAESNTPIDLSQPGTFVDFDEFAQYFRTMTHSRSPLIDYAREASFRVCKSGSFFMSGLKDLRSISRFIDFDLSEVIQKDKQRQQKAFSKGKDIRHPGYVSLKQRRDAFQQERLLASGHTQKITSKAKRQEEQEDQEEKDEFEDFIPSPQFFEDLREAMNHRVLYGSKLRDQEIESILRQKYKRKREEEEGEGEENKQNKKKKSKGKQEEKKFPTIERRVERIPMSWSQVYVYMKHRHATFEIAGCQFFSSTANSWETKTQRICNTFDTPEFSPIEQVYRELSRKKLNRSISAEEDYFMRHMDFSRPSPVISCPKYLFCVTELLEQDLFPFTIFSSYLKDGLFYVMRLIKEISPEYGFPEIPKTQEEINEMKERKKGLPPGTLGHSSSSSSSSSLSFVDFSDKKQIESQLPQIQYLEKILEEDTKELKRMKKQMKKKKDECKNSTGDEQEKEEEENEEEDEETLKLIDENNQKQIRKRPLRTLCWTGQESSASRYRIQKLFLKQGLDVAGLSKSIESGVDLPNGKGCFITSPMPLMDSNEQALSRTIRINSEHPIIKTMIAMSCFPDPNSKISKEDLECLQRMWCCERRDLNAAKEVEEEVLPELRELVKKVKKTVEECIYEKSLFVAEENKPLTATLEVCDPVAAQNTYTQYLYQTLTEQQDSKLWIRKWEEETKQKFSEIVPSTLSKKPKAKKVKTKTPVVVEKGAQSIFESMFSP